MEISIVIPCFNRPNVLRRTLESLVYQTLLPKEVVVVDDASTEPIQDVLSNFFTRLPLRSVRFSTNQGAPAARNEGAKRTTAPFILFLDADAELIPCALEVYAEALRHHPEASFAYANFMWGAKIFRGRPFDAEDLRRVNYIHTSSLIRRSAFPGFDESLKKFQDWDVWLTMAEQGKSGIWIDRTLFRIEPHQAGYSRWLPKMMHRFPWPIFGYMPKEIERYRRAEGIIRAKHHI